MDNFQKRNRRQRNKQTLLNFCFRYAAQYYCDHNMNRDFNSRFFTNSAILKLFRRRNKAK